MVLVCGLGSGFVPFAPGTWGSLMAVAILWWGLSALSITTQLAVIVGVFLIGTWLTHRVQVRTKAGDDGAIVVDEFVGQWMALLGLPADPVFALSAFALFRAFDIAKPWPVGWAERRYSGAFGVMIDDVVAGFGACAVLGVTVLILGSL